MRLTECIACQRLLLDGLLFSLRWNLCRPRDLLIVVPIYDDVGISIGELSNTFTS